MPTQGEKSTRGTAQEGASLLMELQSVLNNHKSDLSVWHESLQQITKGSNGAANANAKVASTTPGVEYLFGAKTLNQPQPGMQAVNTVEPPHKKTMKLVGEVEDSIYDLVNANTKKLVEQGENFEKPRPWEKKDWPVRDPEGLEALLGQVQILADEIAEEIAMDAPSLSNGFSADVEALLRQNVILKEHSDTNSIEVLKLRDQIQRQKTEIGNQKITIDTLQRRLGESVTERNDLAEVVHTGVARAEKEEFCREIQQLTKAKRMLTGEISKLLDEVQDLKEELRASQHALENGKKTAKQNEENLKIKLRKMARERQDLRARNERLEKKLVVGGGKLDNTDTEETSSKKSANAPPTGASAADPGSDAA